MRLQIYILSYFKHLVVSSKSLLGIVLFFVYFFRQNDRKTNCFFYMRLATSATYLGGRMTYFLVFVFLDRMTERQIFYFYIHLATSATYLGERMTYFFMFVFLDRMTER